MRDEQLISLEDCMACDIILVAIQCISCVCSYSNVNNGKERETTLLMRCLATKMTSHATVFSKLFMRYNESVHTIMFISLLIDQPLNAGQLPGTVCHHHCNKSWILHHSDRSPQDNAVSIQAFNWMFSVFIHLSFYVSFSGFTLTLDFFFL